MNLTFVLQVEFVDLVFHLMRCNYGFGADLVRRMTIFWCILGLLQGRVQVGLRLRTFAPKWPGEGVLGRCTPAPTSRGLRMSRYCDLSNGFNLTVTLLCGINFVKSFLFFFYQMG